MKRSLFIILAVCLCLPLLASCRVGLEYELVLTVADSMPSCVAVEHDCFYGYDASGELWKIYWDDTKTVCEGDIYVVRASRVKDIVYSDGTQRSTCEAVPSYLGFQPEGYPSE